MDKQFLDLYKDGSQGVVYLVTSDTMLSGSDIQTIYQKRWKVEEYHNSVKSNASFAKSPPKTIRTQSNPIFACLWAYMKLESLRLQTRVNHFALKGRLYKAALASAYRELQVLKGQTAPAERECINVSVPAAPISPVRFLRSTRGRCPPRLPQSRTGCRAYSLRPAPLSARKRCL